MKKEKKEKELKDKTCTCDCDCGDECNCSEECNCGCDCECNDELVKELTDKLARAQAEVINFKRRKEEETLAMLKYCNKDILLKFVGVADNFERAIKMDDDNLTDEVSKFLSGFKMIYANMVDILRDSDVVEIECIGHEFDPSKMEAIIVEHTEGHKPHEVIDVLQKGYMYKDIILRPAMVKIND